MPRQGFAFATVLLKVDGITILTDPVFSTRVGLNFGPLTVGIKRLVAPALNRDQALYTSAPLPQTGRIMVKDEDVCVHCGLCAERCPTAAWMTSGIR